MYLNLLFKSLKADVGNTERVKAIVRRFVQVLVSGGSGATEFIAGGLFLLGEVSIESVLCQVIEGLLTLF
jgi:ribosome biogenesis protein MAK21